MNLPIILIGPLKTGKSTVGKLLAKRLGLSFYSLDALEKQYTAPAGFDEAKAEEINQQEGDWAWYSYRRQFFADAVINFLLDHPEGVLELGGGHPILPDAVSQKRVNEALTAYKNVVLLLPDPDKTKSLQILNGRLRPEWRADDWNRHFLADDTFQQQATLTIYTQNKTPEQTCQEIIQQLRH